MLPELPLGPVPTTFPTNRSDQGRRQSSLVFECIIGHDARAPHRCHTRNEGELGPQPGEGVYKDEDDSDEFDGFRCVLGTR